MRLSATYTDMVWIHLGPLPPPQVDEHPLVRSKVLAQLKARWQAVKAAILPQTGQAAPAAAPAAQPGAPPVAAVP